MRRLTCVFLTMILAFCLLTPVPCTVSAATMDEAPVGAEVTGGTTGDCKWKYNTDTDELTIYGKGRMADYNSQYDVPWNDYVHTVKSITIESGVTYVGEHSFVAYMATSVSIADTVTEIGYAGFCFSGTVTSLKLSNNLQKVGMSAFTSLGVSSLTLPKSLKEVGTGAFERCKNLQTLVIPDECSCDFADTFESCKALESVYIGKNATIGERAFAYCSATKEYKVPDDHPSLTVHGKNLYNKDRSKLLFYCNGNGAKTSTMSSVVKEIGDYAYTSNPTLTTINLSKNLEIIGKESFAYSKLETFNFNDKSLYSVGESAFKGTPWYRNQPEGIVYAGTVAYKYKGTAPETCNIKAGTLGIGDKCFSEQTTLQHINFADNKLKHIGIWSFYKCSNLESPVIPAKLRSIGNGAFTECRSITSIQLPDTVTELDNYCFYKCTSLTDLRLSENITYLPRWSLAFTALSEEFTVPEKVTKIGWNAFYHTSGLRYINIRNRTAEIEEDAFLTFGPITVRGYKGSTTESFCAANRINFEPFKLTILGDSNGDGTVDLIDATNIQRHIAGMQAEYPLVTLMKGDVDSDGELTIADVTFIQRYQAYMDTPYPIGSYID